MSTRQIDTETRPDGLVAIEGNTYAVRGELKALGATWDSASRVWRIAIEKLSLARAIVDNQDKAAPAALSAAKQEAALTVDLESLPDPFEQETTAPALIPIAGNTYPVKDALKAIGATWDANRRAWMIREEKAAYAQAIVTGQATSPDRKG